MVELATAQTVLDPGGLEFTVSPDHDTADTTGLPIVLRYEFLLYTVGAPTPLRVVDLGKPTPDSNGTVRVALATILNPLPPGGVEYDVRIAAVGAGGSGSSSSSNSFTFSVPCSYSVSPTSRSLGSSGGTSTFSVTAPAGCGWTVTSAAAWITITGGSNGTGSGIVTFSVGANPATSARSGSLTIAGRTVNVSQAAAPCTYSISPTSQTIVRAGGPASFFVTAPAGCSWSASEQSSWISIGGGATGTGNGTVTFTVAANTGAQARSASAIVAGRTVTLSQPAILTRPTAPTGFRIVR